MTPAVRGRLLLGVLLGLLAAGCAAQRPVPPAPELTVARPHRVWLPLYAVGPQVKLGLATQYDWPAERSLGAADLLGASWLYDWSAEPPGSDWVEAVPMVWPFAGEPPALGGTSRWVLGFNEPDLAGQANLTPDAAAVLWERLERAYEDRRLVAPAPSDQHPEWLPQFRRAYVARFGRPPRLDALAVHCYLQSAERCLELVRRFEVWAYEWGVGEVWVTEFAFMPSHCPDAEGEARRFVAGLEADRLITRYSPYMSFEPGGTRSWPDPRPAANPSLVTADGRTLTPMGSWYARR